MANQVGFVDNTGSEGLAFWQMLLLIKTFAEANGWVTLRYLNPSDGSNRELIMKGVGLSGTEAIYVGFRAYYDPTQDYYNLSVACFTGYVDANSFIAQPGYAESGVPAHNVRIDYWLVVNAQRIILVMKVGAGSYESGYTGKFFPYASPDQYPYPVCCIGMLSGVPATRYSDVNYGMGIRGVVGNSPYYGPNALFRDIQGTWQHFYNMPFNVLGSAANRDTGNYYQAKKCVIYLPNPKNIWGELDGIRFVTGFNQVVEDTTVINGLNNVLIRDVTRTGFADYFYLELN